MSSTQSPIRTQVAAPRRTQGERSAATRGRLLDATVDCLIELGYSATTTTVIAERAGVSRGAQLHHFPTKAELVAAAVEHLANKIGLELARRTENLDAKGDRVAQALELLWSAYSTPLFDAWLELAVAARTDEALRATLGAVEQRLGKAVRAHAAELLGDAGTGAPLDTTIELTFYFLHGLALARTIQHDRRRAARERDALRAWRNVVTGLIDPPRL